MGTTSAALAIKQLTERALKAERRAERFETALKRIAKMDGTAGTEQGPMCKSTHGGEASFKLSQVGAFANDIAKFALKFE